MMGGGVSVVGAGMYVTVCVCVVGAGGHVLVYGGVVCIG